MAVALAFWGGQQLMHRAEANLLQVEAEVANALLLEDISRPPTSPPNTRYRTVEIADEWGQGVTLLELHMDMALVDVIIYEPRQLWHTKPYREARVLRQDGYGWQPIEPANIFWSDKRTRETDYFKLEYSARDAHAVEQSIADVEAAYLRLHTDLGLPEPTRGNLVHIKIALVEGSTVRVTDLSYSGDTLIIPPPDLIPRPLDMSNAEALRQAITYSLSVKLFNEAQSQIPTPCTWSAVAEGIGLWLRWEDHTIPSRRRWVYEEVLREQLDASPLLPLEKLLLFPLSCPRPPTMLRAELNDLGHPIPRQELASTLIEYMVATYGRESIPGLLRDLGKFADWNDLTQQSFGISAAELEVGWQAYLNERGRHPCCRSTIVDQ